MPCDFGGGHNNSNDAYSKSDVTGRRPRLESNPVSGSILRNNVLSIRSSHLLDNLDIPEIGMPRFFHIVGCRMSKINLPVLLRIAAFTSRGVRNARMLMAPLDTLKYETLGPHVWGFPVQPLCRKKCVWDGPMVD